jgi:hypothetical protein
MIKAERPLALLFIQDLQSSNSVGRKKTAPHGLSGAEKGNLRAKGAKPGQFPHMRPCQRSAINVMEAWDFQNAELRSRIRDYGFGGVTI